MSGVSMSSGTEAPEPGHGMPGADVRFVLARTTTVPAAAVGALAWEDRHHVWEQVAAARQRVREGRDRVQRLLYDLIGSLEETDPARRAVLNAARRWRRGASVHLPPAMAGELADRLRGCLQEVLADERELERRSTAAEEAFAAERRREEAVVRQWVTSSQPLLFSLMLTAPTLADRLLSPSAAGIRGKVMRSGYRYLVRAALKTSPHLMLLAHRPVVAGTGWGEDWPPGGTRLRMHPEPGGFTFYERQDRARWGAADPSVRCVRPNPSAVRNDDIVSFLPFDEALTPRRVRVDARGAAVLDELARSGGPDGLVTEEVLFSGSAARRWGADSIGEVVEGFVRVGLAMWVLHPDASVASGHPPARAGGPTGSPATPAESLLQPCVFDLSDPETEWSGRAAALRRTFERINDRSAGGSLHGYTESSLPAAVPPGVLDGYRASAEAVGRLSLAFSPCVAARAVLTDLFVTQFGGRRSVGFSQFWSRVAGILRRGEPDTTARVLQHALGYRPLEDWRVAPRALLDVRARQDRIRRRVKELVRFRPSEAGPAEAVVDSGALVAALEEAPDLPGPRSVELFLQRAGDSMVLNGVYPGHGRSLSRFGLYGQGPGSAETPRGAGDVLVLDLATTYGISLARRNGLGDGFLDVPTGTPWWHRDRPGRHEVLRDLLVQLRDDGELVLRLAGEEREVRVVHGSAMYLGFLPALERTLILLSGTAPARWAPLLGDVGRTERADRVVLNRVRFDNLIVRRCKHVVASQDLVEGLASDCADFHDHTLLWERWHERELPDAFFARAHMAADAAAREDAEPVSGKAIKPLYYDTASVVSMADFVKFVRECPFTHVGLEEALPTATYPSVFRTEFVAGVDW
jgi:hypothetical protein